jgi:hypothetical protein
MPSYPNVDAIPGVNDPAQQHWDGKVEHAIEFIPGTRRARKATFTMNDRSGERLEISLEPLMAHRMKGLGYMHPEWGHGHWHGELVIAGESWNDADLDPLALDNIHVQQVVRATCNGKTGYGVLEQLHIGPHPQLGFEDWFDGAK